MKKRVSEKLTLEQALDATSIPMKRHGDFVIVQVDSRIRTPYGGMTDLIGEAFPAGEMRAIFAPSYDRRIAEFEQPQTENHLRDLYRDGGRLESLAHFTDEELALYFEYKAGFITAIGFAGDAGDPSQYETDILTALSGIPDQTAQLVSAVKKTVLSQHKQYKLAATKGRAFPSGRNAGAKGATSNYIEKLNRLHPQKTAKELYRLALQEADTEACPFSKEIDEQLWDNTKDKAFSLLKFEKRLSEIRNPKPKTRT